MKLTLITGILVFALPALLSAQQQIADTAFLPEIENPTWAVGTGPMVYIDEGHNNFHTSTGRFLPFAELLRRDGYRVQPFKGEFTQDALTGCDILVISNALHAANIEDWSYPIPGAFTMLESIRIHKWVKGGGSLLFIADHMPFPQAALEMAKAFGMDFNNGFAMDTLREGPTVFRTSDSTLMRHPITNGRDSTERIDSVATFTGQAMRAKTPDFQPLLVFDSGFVTLMPQEAWEFDENTDVRDVEGWYQGGVIELGEGRVAVFGEAAMFTAQIAIVGPDSVRAGMNSPVAGQNLQFVLNVMHWLSRKL